MTTSQQVAKSPPYLRRYARALTGSQTSGDNFVKATLEAIIAEPEMLEADPRPRVAVYKAFQRIYDSAHIEVDGDGEGDNLERAAQRRLSTIDRKSVVWGTSVSVSVNLGGRRIIKITPATISSYCEHQHNKDHN